MQDPEIPISRKDIKEGKDRAIYTFSRGRTRVYVSLFQLAALVMGLYAVPVHAGVFSALGSLLGLGKDSSALTTSSKNSQTVSLLAPALNIDPNPAKGGGDITIVGQSALLPDTGPLGTRDNTEFTVGGDQISVYVVRDGDTLSQISKMFGVSDDTIIWANDIKGGVIRPGQTLVILPVSGVLHTVKKGDTISSIAKKYKADANDILAHNELSEGHELAVGEELIVPDGKVAIAPRPSSGGVIRGSGGPTIAGYYMRPIAGGKKSQGLHGFNGVDLATLIGSPIFASAEGDVIISRTGWNGGYGNYVVIAHANGTQTLYAHNLENIVFAGQHVVQGQVIGYVGSTGRSTGSHVHFEVRGAANPF